MGETTSKIRVRVIANGQAILVNQVVELARPIDVELLNEPATTYQVEVEPERMQDPLELEAPNAAG